MKEMPQGELELDAPALPVEIGDEPRAPRLDLRGDAGRERALEPESLRFEREPVGRERRPALAPARGADGGRLGQRLTAALHPV